MANYFEKIKWFVEAVEGYVENKKPGIGVATARFIKDICDEVIEEHATQKNNKPTGNYTVHFTVNVNADNVGSPIEAAKGARHKLRTGIMPNRTVVIDPDMDCWDCDLVISVAKPTDDPFYTT